MELATSLAPMLQAMYMQAAMAEYNRRVFKSKSLSREFEI
jgi:hypothetical protein